MFEGTWNRPKNIILVLSAFEVNCLKLFSCKEWSYLQRMIKARAIHGSFEKKFKERKQNLTLPVIGGQRLTIQGSDLWNNHHQTVTSAQRNRMQCYSVILRDTQIRQTSGELPSNSNLRTVLFVKVRHYITHVRKRDLIGCQIVLRIWTLLSELRTVKEHSKYKSLTRFPLLFFCYLFLFDVLKINEIPTAARHTRTEMTLLMLACCRSHRSPSPARAAPGKFLHVIAFK